MDKSMCVSCEHGEPVVFGYPQPRAADHDGLAPCTLCGTHEQMHRSAGEQGLPRRGAQLDEEARAIAARRCP
jgi:hypothetical protein